METNEHDKIIVFDTLYTSNHIQMLKIVMPYFDGPMQKMLAVYIKYLEFRHVLDHFHSHSYDINGYSFHKKEFDIGKICSELLPFCTPEEKKKLGQIADIFRSMEMYKEMSRTIEMMKDLAPDLFADGAGDISSLFAGGGFNPFGEGFNPFGSGSSQSENPAGTESSDAKSRNAENSNSESNDTKNKDTGNSDENSDNNEYRNTSNSETESNNKSNGMMEMLMGMLSPEQKAMFEMFGGNNPHEPE